MSDELRRHHAQDLFLGVRNIQKFYDQARYNHSGSSLILVVDAYIRAERRDYKFTTAERLLAAAEIAIALEEGSW